MQRFNIQFGVTFLLEAAGWNPFVAAAAACFVAVQMNALKRA
jgi:hypothetical protein